MKKYVKPALNIEKAVGINEPVLLYTYGSGDWYKDDCYFAEVSPLQDSELGRNSYTVHVQAHHSALDEHSNHNQLMIFVFDEEIPTGVTAWLDNTYEIEISQDRKRARILTSYMQNPTDNIGSGDFEIWFHDWDETVSLRAYFPTEIWLWDRKWRYGGTGS